MLIAIWAQDQNGLIGKNNRLPWRLPADLQFFKQTTLHHTLVMGRKTFEGMGSRPLPNRQTIVLTRDENYQGENILVMHSLTEVLNFCQKQSEDVFIAGGSGIYQEFLPYCDKLYRTVIEADFEGDAYFPEISWQGYQLCERNKGIKDQKNPYDYYFETYQKLDS